MQALRRDVERRLTPFVEIGAVQWLEWYDAAPAPEQGIADVLQACNPLCAHELWNQMVARGYYPALPTVRLQVVVLWDAFSDRGEWSTDLLRRLPQELKANLPLVEVQPVLILLEGVSSPESQDLRAYWPRIRLGMITSAGGRVTRAKVLDVCRHLLVASIASELMRAIDYYKDEAEWLALGASALIVDIATIRHWLEEAVIRRVLEPWVENPLTASDRQLIKEAVEERASVLQQEMLHKAAGILQESGWKVTLEEDIVRGCRLENALLRETAFGPYRGRLWPKEGRVPGEKAVERFRRLLWEYWELLLALSKPFLPKEQDLSTRLEEHYGRLINDLKQGELVPWLRQTGERLKAFLGSFLDRAVRQAFANRGFDIPSANLPSGLKAAVCAVNAMRVRLSELPIMKIPRDDGDTVHPAALSDERFLRAAAETDALIVQGEMRRYLHFARSLSSPLGVLLNLLPAWPLMGLLLGFLIPAAWFWAGIGLLIIGLGELIYWWLVRARRLLYRIRKKAHQILVDRILTLTTHCLSDMRFWLLTHLREIVSIMEDLDMRLQERYERAKQVCFNMRRAESRAANGSFHLVVDVDEIQREINLIERDIHSLVPPQYGSILTELVARKIWPLAGQPVSALTVLREIEARCLEKIADRWQPARFTPGAIAEGIESLRKGRRWEWLWQQAQPLGQERGASSFTLILAPETELLGATGKNSPFWQEDWLEGDTFQTHEEMCIRGIVCRKRGETR
jgi:hypothetical protein